jgi:hypothetical protein
MEATPTKLRNSSNKALSKAEKKTIMDRYPTQTLQEFLDEMSEAECAEWLDENWY